MNTIKELRLENEIVDLKDEIERLRGLLLQQTRLNTKMCTKMWQEGYNVAKREAADQPSANDKSVGDKHE